MSAPRLSHDDASTSAHADVDEDGAPGAAASQKRASATIVNAALADATRSEQVFVKAVEAAIVARQAADTEVQILERAKGESASAEERVQVATAAATAAIDHEKKVVKLREDHVNAIPGMVKLREDAEKRLVNAAEAEQRATEAVAVAEVELKKAESVMPQHVEGTRAAQTDLKVAKRDAERAATKLTDAIAAEALAVQAIAKAETYYESRQTVAREASKNAYEAREEEGGLKQLVDSALTAASEFIGEGGTWEKRTQATLRERENEHNKAFKIAEKANKEEAMAEAAENEALARLEEATRDQMEKAALVVELEAASKEAAEALVRQTKTTEVVDKAAAEAKDVLEKAQSKLRMAESAASVTTVKKVEDELTRYREAEEEATAKAEDLEVKVAAAKEAMAKAVAESEAAAALAEEKAAVVRNTGVKEAESEAKMGPADAACDELELKAKVLAIAKFEARGATMAMEEAEENANLARGPRRAKALGDVRNVASGKMSAELTSVDKWRLFRQWVAEGNRGAEIWHVRRLFYAIDGQLLSSVNLLVSDILGSALDRGPPAPRQCRLSGDGLTKAAVGKTAKFTIIACNDKGIRFESGGDAFSVAIRYIGLGIKLRCKVIDNDDGSYTITYKPTSTGKCTITVSLPGESLPGSPFSCTVSGPVPTASQCVVYGDALSSMVAQTPSSFFVKFRDALGQVAHACELDVWVHPVYEAGPTAYQAIDAYAPPPPSTPMMAALTTPDGGSAVDGGASTPAGAPSSSADASSSGAAAGVPTAAGGGGAPIVPAIAASSPIPVTPPRRVTPLVDVSEDGPEGQISGFLRSLLMPPAEFESLVVARPIDITRNSDVRSDTIGRLQPGRVLSVAHVEPLSEDGFIRACVLLELDDLEPKEDSTWRELYPSAQDWRTLSWRAHIIETRREEEEAIAMALAIEENHRRQIEQQAGALKLQAGWRGKSARKQTSEIRAEQAALLAAEEEAAAAPVAVPASSASGGKGKRGAKDSSQPNNKAGGKAAADGGTGKGGPGAGGKASSADAGKGGAAAGGAGGKAAKGAGAAPAPSPAKAAPASKAGGKDGKAAAKEDAKAKAAEESRAKVKQADLAKAATKIEALVRGKLGRKRLSSSGAPAAGAPSQDSPAAPMAGSPSRRAISSRPPLRPPSPSKVGGGGLLTPKSAARGKGTKKKKAKESHRPSMPSVPSVDASLARASAEQHAMALRAAKAAASRPQSGLSGALGAVGPLGARRTSPRHGSPRTASAFGPPPSARGRGSVEIYGWVTLAHAFSGEAYVLKQTSRLPAHVRLQHQNHWSKQKALDTERERERALERDREAVGKIITPSPIKSVTPHDHGLRLDLPRNPAYLNDILGDPQRIGFAYGGVYPGRLHAKGQLVEKHEVSYSIGVSGTYLLHVGLRMPHGGTRVEMSSLELNGQVPGSPFMLKVLPGPAYPLSTHMPHGSLPLRGGAVEEVGGSAASEAKERYVCQMRLPARDKMGNLCEGGGSSVTAGFLEAPSQQPPPTPTAQQAQATGSKNDSSETVVLQRYATTRDEGNGVYSITWHSATAGTFDVFVKMDGLHVLGSPCRLTLVAAQQTTRAAAGAKEVAGGKAVGAPTPPGLSRSNTRGAGSDQTASQARQRASKEAAAAIGASALGGVVTSSPAVSPDPLV